MDTVFITFCCKDFDLTICSEIHPGYLLRDFALAICRDEWFFGSKGRTGVSKTIASRADHHYGTCHTVAHT